MAETNNNTPLLNRKEWQTMMPAPVATTAGSCVIAGASGNRKYSLFVSSATVHYLYDHHEDDWLQIPSGAFGGTFGAGTCGAHMSWSINYTANGGSTTTVSVASTTHNLDVNVVGDEIEILTGDALNVGLRRTITAIKTSAGIGNIILTLDSALPAAVASGNTFRVSSGSFFVLNGGATGATSFKRYDIATSTWSSLSATGLPANWLSDGRMTRTYIRSEQYDTGTATSGSATTLVCTGKGWANDQWINYQVRITGGTGQGQKRRITDNTNDTLTFATGATIDATSTFVIEGDEDAIYLMGNNAVTLFKYSVSGNTWATVTPTVARGGNALPGATCDWVGKTGDPQWADITDIRDGRYIYSFRSGGAILDRFNISGGTNGAGAWEVVAYTPNTTSFVSGAMHDWSGEYIYVAQAPSATVPIRIFKYHIPGNAMYMFNSDWYLAGAALIGNRLWIKNLSSEGKIKWLYYLAHTSNILRRIMIF